LIDAGDEERSAFLEFLSSADAPADDNTAAAEVAAAAEEELLADEDVTTVVGDKGSGLGLDNTEAAVFDFSDAGADWGTPL
jgi:hypothetical protein